MKASGIVDHMCFGCSPDNPVGLKLKFSWDDGKLYTVFKARKEHQGYNGYMHGGLISTLLDETMAQWLWKQDIPCMTAEITVRFSKGVPIEQELRIESRCLQERKDRFFEMEGRIVLNDGTVAARSTAKFLKVNLDKFKQK